MIIITIIIATFTIIATLLVIKKQQEKQSINKESLQLLLAEHREKFSHYQLMAMQDTRQQLIQFLEGSANGINQRLEALTNQTNERLKDITGQVEKRLSDGFEKTNATFTDIVKRLALIDEAQKKMTELSSHVLSLQSILSDKRARGAFGEVQLNHLIRDMLPEQNFSLQYTLSNHTRCDCILFLPHPTGNVVIDAKFPLENYQKNQAQAFKQDLKTHIQAIASKYIIAGETADGAMMFIPAEAIFADIHAHHPDIVQLAQQKRVWLTSPTTLMAILTTARAVLKDAETRKQVHLIQEHLIILAKDFDRFQNRMDNLAKHIDQAQQDVSEAHTSAKKISNRFTKIERLEVMSDN